MTRHLSGLVVLGVLRACVAVAAGEEAGVPTATDAPDTNIAQETAAQTLKTRLEFAQKCGISPVQFQQVMRTKLQLARIEHALVQDAQALAITLGSDTISDAEKVAAVQRYLQHKEQALKEYHALEQQLIVAVGADKNPLAMGALIVLGAADSGKRSTCTVKSPVAGGAGMDLQAAPGVNDVTGLAASFGFPGARPLMPGGRRWRRLAVPGQPTAPTTVP